MPSRFRNDRSLSEASEPLFRRSSSPPITDATAPRSEISAARGCSTNALEQRCHHLSGRPPPPHGGPPCPSTATSPVTCLTADGRSQPVRVPGFSAHRFRSRCDHRSSPEHDGRGPRVVASPTSGRRPSATRRIGPMRDSCYPAPRWTEAGRTKAATAWGAPCWTPTSPDRSHPAPSTIFGSMPGTVWAAT